MCVCLLNHFPTEVEFDPQHVSWMEEEEEGLLELQPHQGFFLECIAVSVNTRPRGHRLK